MLTSKRANVALWALQGFLALFFAVASGAPKLVLPFEMLGMPLLLPMPFVKFIGVAEVLGGLGLILPGLTHIRPGLTPLAAGGLALVALSGAVYQLAAAQPANAVFAVVMGLLASTVAWLRWRQAPHANTRATRPSSPRRPAAWSR
jgi:hypothetical protein